MPIHYGKPFPPNRVLCIRIRENARSFERVCKEHDLAEMASHIQRGNLRTQTPISLPLATHTHTHTYTNIAYS